jgi:hypothetical protein
VAWYLVKHREKFNFAFRVEIRCHRFLLIILMILVVMYMTS